MPRDGWGRGTWRGRAAVAQRRGWAWEDADVALDILLFCNVGRNAGRAEWRQGMGQIWDSFFCWRRGVKARADFD